MFLSTTWRGRTPSLAAVIGPGDRRRDRATRLRVRRTRVPPDRRRGRAPLTERSRFLPARCAAGVDGAARAPARSRPPARCCIGRVEDRPSPPQRTSGKRPNSRPPLRRRYGLRSPPRRLGAGAPRHHPEADPAVATAATITAPSARCSAGRTRGGRPTACVTVVEVRSHEEPKDPVRRDRRLLRRKPRRGQR